MTSLFNFNALIGFGAGGGLVLLDCDGLRGLAGEAGDVMVVGLGSALLRVADEPLIRLISSSNRSSVCFSFATLKLRAAMIPSIFA
jgi:hypothetical protein